MLPAAVLGSCGWGASSSGKQYSCSMEFDKFKVSFKKGELERLAVLRNLCYDEPVSIALLWRFGAAIRV